MADAKLTEARTILNNGCNAIEEAYEFMLANPARTFIADPPAMPATMPAPRAK